ncbi:MAG TPA: hypothetical protein VFV53_01500 [Candidatus Limnocylindrales bacterium]|nr:hypothetical protein [Candidatus Limnocylindrales bacterium]
MTSPLGTTTPPPEPGDRPPVGHPTRRLARPPSERYAAAGGRSGPGPGPEAGDARASLGALAPAIAAGIVTAAALVVVGSVLAEQRGLLAIAGIGGAAIGLLGAGAAVSPDGLRPPALSRGRVVRVAVGLALLTIAVAAIGTWAYGRLEGGVLDPLTYLWSVYGPLIPAEAAIAAITAAWGAGAGPIRSRS